MSEDKIEFRVPVTHIKEIIPHPNPKVERLEIAIVFGFSVIVRKGQYQKNDTVVYVPVDSILPNALEAKIFGPDSKIKLTKGRVRQVRIQQFASQGMLIDLKDLDFQDAPKLKLLEEGQNLAELLGITKYEPPVPDFQSNLPRVKKERNKEHENMFLHTYGGVENFKWYPDVFEEGQQVVYQEKIHGTNARAAILPYQAKGLVDKIRKLLGILPKYQFCYGSNTVQLQAKRFTGYYDTNVYAEACEKYGIKGKLNPHETVYFEIYGASIQKNYMYDCAPGERKIVVFDVKVLADDCKSTRFLSTAELKQWCQDRDLPLVPYLYCGGHSKELAKEYSLRKSRLNPNEDSEGIVIKDPKETVSFFGKKYLKLISEHYLDNKDNTDNH